MSFIYCFDEQTKNKLSLKDYGKLKKFLALYTTVTLVENFDSDEEKKEETKEFIIKEFLKYFDTVNEENITRSFAATSKTFYSFINIYIFNNCNSIFIIFLNLFFKRSFQ